MSTNGNLSDRAMLAALSISVWTARRYDRKISDEVAKGHNTGTNAGRYNKNLLPVNSEAYKAVIQASGAARTSHYNLTLPWSDEGSRILPAKNFAHYTEVMRQHRTEFETAVAEFVQAYPQLQAYAKTYLNGLYDDEDYPSPASLPWKFGFALKFYPLPTGSDFRVNLADSDVEAIRQQIESDTQNAIVAASQDLWRRLHTGVSRMVERLADDKNIFRDSLIENLKDLCELLPRLNLTNDAKLTDMCSEVQDKLTIYDPQSLRDSKKLRSQVATEADAIQQQMAAYMAPAPVEQMAGG